MSALKELASNERLDSTAKEKFESFEKMGLSDTLLRGIYSYGFEKPSAIQSHAIKPFMDGKDLIAQAQSGTGKTAAFTIGCLQRINPEEAATQALLLSPTRELALQTYKVVANISEYMKLRIVCCIGGASVRDMIARIEDGAQIIVGTPGRVIDMLNRRVIKPDGIKVLVLDEADEMLSQGFKDQIYEIFQCLPETMQVGLFSATMPPDAIEISKRFMRDPVKILVKREELTLEGIKQFYISVEKEEYKLPTLCDLYSTLSIAQTVIFVNTRRKVDSVSAYMNKEGYPVACTHGDLDANERTKVLMNFKEGKSRVLITTDLFARGIDVQQVSLVINYDLPTNFENYIHRIGRGARFGRKGVAINFVTDNDVSTMREIEKTYETEIKEMPQSISEYL